MTPEFTPIYMASAAGGRWTQDPAADARVLGFGIDTRDFTPGHCFVALKTAHRDGHDYLAVAKAAGASAAIVARPNPSVDLPQLVVADPLAALQALAAAHRRDFRGIVIGVTGSVGKTSTKELLARLLSSTPGEVLATSGNLNNHLGVPLTLTKLNLTVHRYAVVEAGIGGPGEMDVLARMIEPDLALVTHVGPAHLEALGSLENVAREKAILLARARPGSAKFFPRSCLDFAAFRNLSAPATALDPTIWQDAEITTIRFTPSHLNPAAAEPILFTCRRVSEGMARNVALAVAAALQLGVSPSDAQRRLLDWEPAALRGEICRDPAGRWLYVDCYNANPASMHDALAAFAGMAPADQPRLFIIGGMEELGEESLAYHRELGVALARTLRTGDSALVLAGQAAAEAVVNGADHPSVTAASDLASLRIRLESHRGAVFIKGSRRYQLESLLLPKVTVAHAHDTTR
jgi:UDP-N-acetylmuramoyl-tripeptide--D-alanyl-D-alanine ligase